MTDSFSTTYGPVPQPQLFSDGLTGDLKAVQDAAEQAEDASSLGTRVTQLRNSYGLQTAEWAKLVPAIDAQRASVAKVADGGISKKRKLTPAQKQALSTYKRNIRNNQKYLEQLKGKVKRFEKKGVKARKKAIAKQFDKVDKLLNPASPGRVHRFFIRIGLAKPVVSDPKTAGKVATGAAAEIATKNNLANFYASALEANAGGVSRMYQNLQAQMNILQIVNDERIALKIALKECEGFERKVVGDYDLKRSIAVIEQQLESLEAFERSVLSLDIAQQGKYIDELFKLQETMKGAVHSSLIILHDARLFRQAYQEKRSVRNRIRSFFSRKVGKEEAQSTRVEPDPKKENEFRFIRLHKETVTEIAAVRAELAKLKKQLKSSKGDKTQIKVRGQVMIGRLKALENADCFMRTKPLDDATLNAMRVVLDDHKRAMEAYEQIVSRSGDLSNELKPGEGAKLMNDAIDQLSYVDKQLAVAERQYTMAKEAVDKKSAQLGAGVKPRESQHRLMELESTLMDLRQLQKSLKAQVYAQYQTDFKAGRSNASTSVKNCPELIAKTEMARSQYGAVLTTAQTMAPEMPEVGDLAPKTLESVAELARTELSHLVSMKGYLLLMQKPGFMDLIPENARKEVIEPYLKQHQATIEAGEAFLKLLDAIVGPLRAQTAGNQATVAAELSKAFNSPEFERYSALLANGTSIMTQHKAVFTSEFMDRFRAWVSINEHQPLVDSLGITSMFAPAISTAQRVPRYPILMREVCKRIDEAHLAPLAAVMKQVELLSAMTNENVRCAEAAQMAKVHEVSGEWIRSKLEKSRSRKDLRKALKRSHDAQEAKRLVRDLGSKPEDKLSRKEKRKLRKAKRRSTELTEANKDLQALSSEASNTIADRWKEKFSDQSRVLPDSAVRDYILNYLRAASAA